MARQTKSKILFGSNMKHSGWGLRGCAKGMYTGGFNYYVYGIKGLFGYTVYEAWGGFINNNPNLN